MERGMDTNFMRLWFLKVVITTHRNVLTNNYKSDRKKIEICSKSQFGWVTVFDIVNIPPNEFYL